MELDDVEISCSGCGRRAERVGPLGTCHQCGGILIADYDLDGFRERAGGQPFTGNGVWRYQRLLPVRPRIAPVSLGEGGTTLLTSERLSEILGMRRLTLKNETTNPTGSFVDRGTTVEMTFARDSGCRAIATALSGNLAASAAAYAARAGLRAEAFLPTTVDIGKLYQVVAYGAKVVSVSDQEEAERRLLELGEEYQRITPESPFFLEGIKTTGLEIAEQLGWRAPDRIVLSIGNGSHIAMIWKALRELRRLGLVGELETRMTGVQMLGCAPIVEALGGRDGRSRGGNGVTLAREIAVQHPHMTQRVVQAIRESDGTAVAVDEREIIDAVQMLARAEGIYAEPAAAASIAGLRRLLEQGEIDRGERVVCVITGTGLKEPIASRKEMRRFASAGRMAKRMERRLSSLDLGSTKEAVLELIGREGEYGYGIWKRLRDERGVSISVVSVYQHLQELEAAQLVKKARVERSPTRRKRVYYSLTEPGERFLARGDTREGG